MAEIGDLILAVPFDQPVYSEQDCLGGRHVVDLPNFSVELFLPESPMDGQIALRAPQKTSERVAKHVEGWGLLQHGECQLECVVYILSVNAAFDFDIASNQVGGEGVQEVVDAVGDWHDRFCNWIWCLTAQSLNPAQPDPGQIHRKSRNMIQALAIGGDSSYASSASPPIAVGPIGRGTSCSERLVAPQTVSAAIHGGRNGPPSLAIELIAASRMHGRFGDTRQGFLDIATAAEAILTARLGLATTHKLTLGELVKAAQKNGVSVPHDTYDMLVQPRNDAMHRGERPSFAKLCRAIDIVEGQLIELDPAISRIDRLTSFHRPYRFDMVIVQGPKPQQ